MTDNFKPKSGGYQKPQLSTEQWIEKRKAEKETLYNEINETASSIVQDADKFKGYLDVQSRNDRYSVANCLTLLKYCPNASKLREYDDWMADNAQGRKSDVYIKKGAKAIPILEPYEFTKKDGTTGIDFNIKKMFDVSQTTAKQTPAPTSNRDPRALVAVMLDTSPVNVEMTDELPYPNMGAFYNNDKQTLFIKRDIGDSVALCQCVAQELAHAQLSIHSETYSRKDMGFQAMCVGYMLCKKYGVDVKNFNIERIPDEWKSRDIKEIRAELSETRYAMSEIHSRVSDELHRQKQQRSKEQER